MLARRYPFAFLAALGLLCLGRPVSGAEEVCVPGTVITVTAPDGDYIASFDEGYTLYNYDGSLGGIYDRHESYAVMGLALGPDGRVYIADGTIIYRLEEDGTATRMVGTPQQPAEGGAAVFFQVRQNVLEDSVAALEAHIVPGAMAFDREGPALLCGLYQRGGCAHRPTGGRRASDYFCRYRRSGLQRRRRTGQTGPLPLPNTLYPLEFAGL